MSVLKSFLRRETRRSVLSASAVPKPMQPYLITNYSDQFTRDQRSLSPQTYLSFPKGVPSCPDVRLSFFSLFRRGYRKLAVYRVIASLFVPKLLPQSVPWREFHDGKGVAPWLLYTLMHRSSNQYGIVMKMFVKSQQTLVESLGSVMPTNSVGHSSPL